MDLYKKMMLTLMVILVSFSSFTVCTYIAKLEDLRLRSLIEKSESIYWEKYIYDDTAPKIEYMNNLRKEIGD